MVRVTIDLSSFVVVATCAVAQSKDLWTRLVADGHPKKRDRSGPLIGVVSASALRGSDVALR